MEVLWGEVAALLAAVRIVSVGCFLTDLPVPCPAPANLL